MNFQVPAVFFSFFRRSEGTQRQIVPFNFNWIWYTCIYGYLNNYSIYVISIPLLQNAHKNIDKWFNLDKHQNSSCLYTLWSQHVAFLVPIFVQVLRNRPAGPSKLTEHVGDVAEGGQFFGEHACLWSMFICIVYKYVLWDRKTDFVCFFDLEWKMMGGLIVVDFILELCNISNSAKWEDCDFSPQKWNIDNRMMAFKSFNCILVTRRSEHICWSRVPRSEAMFVWQPFIFGHSKGVTTPVTYS